MANRVSQASIEALVQPEDTPARVSHASLEALVLPDVTPARVSLAAIEVLYSERPPKGRTQIIILI